MLLVELYGVYTNTLIKMNRILNIILGLSGLVLWGIIVNTIGKSLCKMIKQLYENRG